MIQLVLVWKCGLVLGFYNLFPRQSEKVALSHFFSRYLLWPAVFPVGDAEGRWQIRSEQLFIWETPGPRLGRFSWTTN